MPRTVTLEDLSEPAPEPGPADWNDEGVVVLKSFLEDNNVYRYQDEWAHANGYKGFIDHDGVAVLLADQPGGWPHCTPYMQHPNLLQLVCGSDLADTLYALTGEPMGVHLNLTGWVSTQRNWHQDTYLNPPHVGDYYAAVWFCLEDVDPRSGPFQYVPGSHRWHQLSWEKIDQAGIVDMNNPAWPKHTEDVLTPLVEDEIEARDAEIVTYLPERGDVLIWHSRLYHRGSTPQVPNAFRGALIAHYSGIHHRPDMPSAMQHKDAGWYFPIQESGPV
jgi:hypothetical protein